AAATLRRLDRAWCEAEGPDPRGAYREGLDRGPVATHGAGANGHPDLRHYRHTEGRRPGAAEEPRPGGRIAVDDPAEGPRDDAYRSPAVPLLGLRPLHARPAAGIDVRPAAQIRP